jgi:hypothetical protein
VNRRGFLTGLAVLALPAIIRDPSRLMRLPAPKVAQLQRVETIGFIHDVVVSEESYSAAWSDWRGMFGTYAGDMDSFPFAPEELTTTDRNVDLAMARMRRLREMEDQIARQFNEGARRAACA